MGDSMVQPRRARVTPEGVLWGDVERWTAGMCSKRAGDQLSVWDFLAFYLIKWRSARAMLRARRRG